MRSFNKMSEVFDLLNHNKINYAVLRNYENLLDDQIYMTGHGDVDLICDDSLKLAKVIGAMPQDFHTKKEKHDGVHFSINIKNNAVSLDLRYIGDRYYCSKWQTEMLNRRVIFNSFYVLGKEDYFYTLVYHAIYQKPILTEEYRNRLIGMAKNLSLNIVNNKPKDFIILLESYMKKNHYVYQYPKDKYVPFNSTFVQDKSLLNFCFDDYYKNKLFHLKVSAIDKLVSIKHFIENNLTKKQL